MGGGGGGGGEGGRELEFEERALNRRGGTIRDKQPPRPNLQNYQKSSKKNPILFKLGAVHPSHTKGA